MLLGVMTVPIVFLDECGFTGEDLADPEQPVFVVASHNLSDEDAAEVRGKFFGSAKAEELKHSRLQRRETYRAAILRALSELLERDVVRVTLAHKPFVLVAKIVDWLLEPAFHADGFDMYEDGACLAFANGIYMCLAAEDKGLLESVTRSFQCAARARDPMEVREFYTLLLSARFAKAVGRIHEMIEFAHARLGDGWLLNLPRPAIDISVTVALQTCYSWRVAGLTHFEVVHDRSSAMARDRAVWDAITSRDAPPAVIGNGAVQIPFPIGVEGTRFEDSKQHVALQVADVVAGAAARWGSWVAKGKPTDDRYGASLHEMFMAHFKQAVAGMIWPTDSVEPKRAPANVVNPVDYLMNVVARSRGSAD
jgi:uncharacterized protein DUF3800